jgi:protein-disulfide isomerase
MSTRLRVEVGPEDHVQGPADAPVTLVEYGDFECPHCGRAHPIIKRVQRHFGDRLRLVYRHFPLSEIHPNAEPAAEASEFAGSEDKFWEMHDALFENQDELSPATILELAVEIGLDGEELSEALEAGTFEQKVRRDFSSGVRSGVNGTPTFFINGVRHDGSYEYTDLVTAIDLAENRRAA